MSRPERGASRPPAYPLPGSNALSSRIAVQWHGKDHVNRRIGSHKHTFLEMLYVERGAGSLRVETRRIEADPGRLLMVFPGETNDVRDFGEAEGWVLAFMPDALGNSRPGPFFPWAGGPMLAPFLAADPVARSIVVPEGARRWFSGALEKLHDELRSEQPGYELVSASLLKALVVEASRHSPGAPARRAAETTPLLEEVFAFVEERYSEPISLRDVARAVGLSPAYLTTQVGRMSGRTVVEWIARRRMFEARRLLSQTDEPVAAIARRVGYSDPTHFTRLFSRAHGRTPLSYRLAARDA